MTERKTKVLRAMVSPAERHTFLAAAEASGLSFSAWMRIRLREAAGRDLTNPLPSLDIPGRHGVTAESS